MSSKGMVYVTTMYRWGERENHSYIIYVGIKKNKAIKVGEDESNYRGGKYWPEILEFDPKINDKDKGKTVHGLNGWPELEEK